MKTEFSLSYYLRILIVSLFITVLGLGPSQYAAGELLVNANQSITSGDFLTASRTLADAGEYYPWRHELNLTAGRLAMEAGDPKSATSYFERPWTASHLTVDDMILLGDAYLQNGDPYMAEATWKRVTELGEISQAHERLANLYLQRKDYASAITSLQKILFLEPSNIHLYYEIGTLFAATDPIKSLPFLAQAVEMDPTNASKAQALHDKIHTSNLYDEPAYTFVISGRQFANWGEWELAAEAFHRATVLVPGYADAWALLGEARQQIAIQEAGFVSDAGLSDLNHALQLDAKSILANSLMAIYWERQEDYSQAQVFLEYAIASSPKDPFLYAELGNILAKAGDLPAAQAAYEAAIQLTPQDPLFYRLLAEFALGYQIQIRELALPAARQAITLAPNDASSLDVMAQVMLMLQDYHSAERFALSALQSNPGYAQASLHLGMTYIYLEEPDLARRWLTQAETLNPDSWVATQAERMMDYYFP